MDITKKCAVSGEDFIVRDEDAEFLKQISPVLQGKKYFIPPPKLCPLERQARRLTYRNERRLYKRKSSLSGSQIISFFHPNAEFVVYSREEWWSDKWDSMFYARNFDFNRGFFEQFREMQLVVPRPPLVNNKAENSDYCNFSDINKNCYLLTSSNRNRDSYYGFVVVDSRDTVDVTSCVNGELLYECIDCNDCYDLNFCQNCEHCIESDFLFNCQAVRNCFMCAGLRNKEQYFFLNKPLQKHEYEQKIRELKADAVKLKEAYIQFEDLKRRTPVKALNISSCENVVGDYVFNSKNIFLGFVVYTSENCSYLHEGVKAGNCMDICFFDSVQWCYESTSLMGYGYRFTNFCRDSTDLFYCDNCHGCRNCFGCIGLRNKEYRIFNKQYKADDYEDMMLRILRKMTETGEWGEYFPAKYSLFSYNETLAQDFFPLNIQNQF